MAAESSMAASGNRSGGGGGGPSTDSYIGSLISLTSKSEIRYEGILYNINTEESSIGLRNVRSFGTEGRKKDGPQVPPSDKIYEYILFRGTDIKDLQVKASPPVQTTPPINSDPAIIQSHYTRPTTPPTSLPTAPIGPLPDLGSHSAQMGLPGPAFPNGLPLYQPGGNLNAWGPSPPNANGSGLPMQMYWQGYYGSPNGIPQLPQQSLLRPPSGLPIAPSMQQMQFAAFNPSLPMGAPNLPSSNLPDYHSSLVPNSTNSSSLTSSPSLPASTFSMSVPTLLPVSLASETMNNQLPNKAPLSSLPTSSPSSGLPSLAPFSVPDPAGVSSVSNRTIAAPGPAALPQQNASQPVTSFSGTSGSGLIETSAPSLITPGHLLHSGPSAASAPQTLKTTQKDVEVVQLSQKPLSELSAPVVTEAQPPILPLPPNARAHKPNGGAYHMRSNYRGRGGRGPGASRPVTKFTEDFDFTAMNEKFKKDEVWGHLGKSNRKDNEGNGSGSDEEPHDENDVELPIEIKPLYNKDDFFDSISSNALDNDANRGRTRYSEQMKLDTETFGEFSRYRGGRGGRGPNRGRFRGSSYGRGYNGYGYGYVSRGRGRGVQNRDF